MKSDTNIFIYILGPIPDRRRINTGLKYQDLNARHSKALTWAWTASRHSAILPTDKSKSGYVYDVTITIKTCS
jgi:hypothetical protein